jgi:hypothetical protein
LNGRLKNQVEKMPVIFHNLMLQIKISLFALVLEKVNLPKDNGLSESDTYEYNTFNSYLECRQQQNAIEYLRDSLNEETDVQLFYKSWPFKSNMIPSVLKLFFCSQQLSSYFREQRYEMISILSKTSLTRIS